MTKRILITGITGMAGSHLADYLLKEEPGVEILGTKRWRSNTSNVAHFGKTVKLVDCDLTDPVACMHLIKGFRPDYIFHLAAQSYVLDSWANPTATITDNIAMQLNLFEAIRFCELSPVIQVALSSEEYGKVYEHELPMNEKNPLRPLSPYAVSKVAQDMLAYQYYESYGMKTVRTRTFNHEGPRRGEVFVTSNFAKQIAEAEAGLREPVVYVGNLEAKRDWSDVRDVVRAYWLAVNHCNYGEEYVIASGVTRTVDEMLQLMISQSKVKIEIRVDEARMRPSDVRVLHGDYSKFKAATGWEPKIPFETTMLDLLNYWRMMLKSGAVTTSAATTSR